MTHNYSIECYNIERNRWEVAELARTFDEAFNLAEKYIGFSKIHDTVAILDNTGAWVWKSDDPIPSRMKDVGLEEQQHVAADGSC
jgi:hypothetical protein